MSHNFWFNITTYIINYDKVRLLLVMQELSVLRNTSTLYSKIKALLLCYRPVLVFASVKNYRIKFKW